MCICIYIYIYLREGDCVEGAALRGRPLYHIPHTTDYRLHITCHRLHAIYYYCILCPLERAGHGGDERLLGADLLEVGDDLVEGSLRLL